MTVPVKQGRHKVPHTLACSPEDCLRECGRGFIISGIDIDSSSWLKVTGYRRGIYHNRGQMEWLKMP
jgi:hypothetical protein